MKLIKIGLASIIAAGSLYAGTYNDFDKVKTLNPNIVYGSISGYADEGPWKDKPGQDLLVQAVSGLTWLSGNADDGPVPMGLAVADIFAGAQLAQGILAKLAGGEGVYAQCRRKVATN